jgi:hypothetical protein
LNDGGLPRDTCPRHNASENPGWNWKGQGRKRQVSIDNVENDAAKHLNVDSYSTDPQIVDFPPECCRDELVRAGTVSVFRASH